VFPNQDVQVKMSIESKDVLGASTLTPTFTERTISGTARVQNNRTMMLASVSQDVQTNGRTGLPLLGLIPVLGRFFTSPTKDNRQIDIVIAVTPRVLRAPAVMPRDEEMRPSGTLQSPTTGSLEAMLREADREEQLAAASLQRRNAAARPNNSFEPAPATVNTAVAGNTNAANTAPPANAVTNTAAIAEAPKNVTTSPADNSQVAKNSTPNEELPAFVPAPKSLVSNSEATQVAAVNTNLNANPQAVLTNMTKPIDTALSSASTSRTAQLLMTPNDAVLKVGETRRFALELTSDTSLAMAVLALRFNPKTVRIKGLSAGTQLSADSGNKENAPAMTQSIDANGVCLISLANLQSAASLKGAGLWLFIDVEALSAGDAGLVFDKGATHLMAADAGNVMLDLAPINATVKQ
jgi:general secretion pathway protein D